MYLGDFALGDTLYFKFTTRRFSTGAPHTLAGTPALSAYEDDSTTQITAGITLTADFDSVTGLNHVTVVATGGNGYESGKQYDIVITTGTVDSVSVVGEVVGRFSIEAGAALRPATAGRTLAVDANGRVDLSAWLGAAVNALIAGRVDANAQVVGDKTGYAIGVGGIAATAFAAAAIDAAALAQDAEREIADEILNRDIAGGASGGSRNVRNALRGLRNRHGIAGGTLTVYAEDDSTPAWTAAVTTTAGDPISEVDPS